MKSELYVQFKGNSVDTKKLMETAKEIWKSEGNKIKDLDTVELYCKKADVTMCLMVKALLIAFLKFNYGI